METSEGDGRGASAFFELAKVVEIACEEPTMPTATAEFRPVRAALFEDLDRDPDAGTCLGRIPLPVPVLLPDRSLAAIRGALTGEDSLDWLICSFRTFQTFTGGLESAADLDSSAESCRLSPAIEEAGVSEASRDSLFGLN